MQLTMYGELIFGFDLLLERGKLKSTMSIATSFLRAKFCEAPVRKACVKKKPEIQKSAGMPWST